MNYNQNSRRGKGIGKNKEITAKNFPQQYHQVTDSKVLKKKSSVNTNKTTPRYLQHSKIFEKQNQRKELFKSARERK